MNLHSYDVIPKQNGPRWLNGTPRIMLSRGSDITLSEAELVKRMREMTRALHEECIGAYAGGSGSGCWVGTTILHVVSGSDRKFSGG